MSEGNLQIGEIKKKKADLNRTKGINTGKAVFQTNDSDTTDDNPYAMSNRMQQPYMSRVEELANKGPLMSSRVHTQNPNDIAFEKKVEKQAGKEDRSKVRSDEGQRIIKAQPDLRVFTEDVMKKGTFTPEAKEAAKHFFRQITDWAGSFDDDGSGFYGSMGISSVLDCLYVDGMNLRNYLKEQYYYKTTGNPAQDIESVRNYVALIAARGEHIITLVRPTVKGDGAEVEYRNMYVDLSEVGEEQAAKSRRQKEKGNQVRSDLKKRIDDDMTERTGMAYRKAYGCDTDGFDRIEKAKSGLAGADAEQSEEYREFNKCFEHYHSGLQKLGLKPGRDDINRPVAEEMKKRCEDAIKAAESFIDSASKYTRTVTAVENAKRNLETDLKLLDRAIDTKLYEEGARMRLDEMLDSRRADLPDDDKNGQGDDDGSSSEDR